MTIHSMSVVVHEQHLLSIYLEDRRTGENQLISQNILERLLMILELLTSPPVLRSSGPPCEKFFPRSACGTTNPSENASVAAKSRADQTH
jgi:hypothetical protein